MKTQWDKTLIKEKECSTSFTPPDDNNTLMSLNWCIQMPLISLSSVAVDNVLENKSARVSCERISCSYVSPFFWRSWVEKILVRYVLFYHLWYTLLLVELYILHYLCKILLNSFSLKKTTHFLDRLGHWPKLITLSTYLMICNQFCIILKCRYNLFSTPSWYSRNPTCK